MRPGLLAPPLDRLLHRSTLINIRGDSYRLKEKCKAKSTTKEEITEE